MVVEPRELRKAYLVISVLFVIYLMARSAKFYSVFQKNSTVFTIPQSGLGIMFITQVWNIVYGCTMLISPRTVRAAQSEITGRTNYMIAQNRKKKNDVYHVGAATDSSVSSTGSGSEFSEKKDISIMVSCFNILSLLVQVAAVEVSVIRDFSTAGYLWLGAGICSIMSNLCLSFYASPPGLANIFLKKIPLGMIFGYCLAFAGNSFLTNMYHQNGITNEVFMSTLMGFFSFVNIMFSLILCNPGPSLVLLWQYLAVIISFKNPNSAIYGTGTSTAKSVAVLLSMASTCAVCGSLISSISTNSFYKSLETERIRRSQRHAVINAYATINEM